MQVKLKEMHLRGLGRHEALGNIFAEFKAKASKYLQRLDLCHMVKHLQKHFGKDEIIGLIKIQGREEM